MRRTIAGVPLWIVLVVVGGGGLYWYTRRQQAAAQAAAQAAQAAATPSNPSGTGDPFLTAYQAGESSGVSIYSAGVGTGLSLVDSILGMFPASLSPTAPTSPTGTAPPPPVNTGRAQLGNGYSIIPGRSPGAVDELHNGQFIGSYWIPQQGTKQIQGGYSIGEAGDKAVGSYDVFQGSKFVGAY